MLMFSHKNDKFLHGKQIKEDTMEWTCSRPEKVKVEREKSTWENHKIDLKKRGCEDLDWTELA